MKIIKYRAWSKKIGAFIYWQSNQKSPLGMFWELCQSEGLEPELYSKSKQSVFAQIQQQIEAFWKYHNPGNLDKHAVRLLERIVNICKKFSNIHQNPELMGKD